MTLAALLVLPLVTGRGASPRFYPDDPIAIDNDRALDAGKATPIEGSNGYDFANHTFRKPGDRRDVHAMNTNSVDDVPNSSWFTNRLGTTAMTIDEIVRGPNRMDSLNIDGWPIVQEKSSGITPGFRVADPSGRLYQIKFDPPSNPEMSTAPEPIGAAFYHAFGYNVVEGYLVEFDPSKIVIAPTATTVDLRGIERTLRREDIERILRRAARLPNGKYRALASRFADGRPMGYFKYYGTRPDDPNDIVSHEHRRELRGSRVFAAWINHDDSRGINSLDMMEGAEGRQWIKHYMFDFGSTMGSGSTIPQAPRAGNEYILEWAPAFKTLFSLGLWVRPWIHVDYPEIAPSVGNFEADFFDPVKWKPEYPNPAFDNMREDDAFWAARILSNLSDEAIRAVIAKGQYSDPRAAGYITRTLIERRNKIVSRWLTGVNPVVNPVLDADGTLRFENAAVAAGVAKTPTGYEVVWSRFDNATNQATGARETAKVTETRAIAPVSMRSADFLAADISATHPDHSSWAIPVTVHFRRTSSGWQTVGLQRLK